MAFTAVVLAYMLRVSISYALTQMLVHPHRGSNSTIVGADICPPFDDEIILVPGATAKPDVRSVCFNIYDFRFDFISVLLGSDMGKVRLVPRATRINSVRILLGLYCIPRTGRLAGSQNRWKACNYIRNGYCGHLLFSHTEIY